MTTKEGIMSPRTLMTRIARAAWLRTLPAFFFGLAALLALGAAPALAADCPDGDSDGYVVCGGCDVPMGKSCGDCNDGNANISPGDPELCGTGVDEDCDGTIDDGFQVINLDLEDMGKCMGGVCDVDNSVPCATDMDCSRMCENSAFNRPMGCSAGDAGGCCRTFGRLFCTPDKLSLECKLVTSDVGPCTSNICQGDGITDCNSNADCMLTQPIKQHEPEGDAGDGGANDPDCFDGQDNDCDGSVDQAQMSCQTEEICDGVDNDGNMGVDEGFAFMGIDIGDPCMVGTGVCKKTGSVVCDGTMAAKCSATPGAAGIEGPPQSASCGDGLDNDCDGSMDLADAANCTEAEKCDGIDNDNDGDTDETFDVGTPCDNGLAGQCFAEGQTVCTANGAGTMCNAVANVAQTEGPKGPTCTDVVDNDCDALADAADPDCASADIAATCALPYFNGKPGKDCEGWHTIKFSTAGAGPGAKVTAELLGLTTEGEVIGSIPGVKVNEQVHMNSRLNPVDWKFKTSIRKGKREHEIYAPVPMLRVTVNDGANKAVAYCSNIPFLQVTEPNGGVVSASEANLVDVRTAIPRDALSTLFVKVDGVDILDALNIDPATDFPGGPFSGTVMIGMDVVKVTDLIVDAPPSGLTPAAAIGTPAANALTMTLEGLPCGGHVIVVDGEGFPGVIVPSTTLQCHHDDIRDKGNMSVFKVEINDPTDGENTSEIPTPVEGQVCHGRSIVNTKVNSKSLDVSSQVLVPGDGEDSGDKVTLDFMTSLPQTDILGDFMGTNNVVGTFDHGSNTAYATAEDDLGNVTSDDVNFTIGQVSTASASLSSAQLGVLNQTVQDTLEKGVRNALNGAGTNIKDAFILGVEQDALNTFFAETCKFATADIKAQLVKAVNDAKIPSVTVEKLCDPVVHIDLHDAAVAAGNVTCNVQMANNIMIVTVDTPPITMAFSAKGDCCSGCDFICWHSVEVDVQASASITPEVNIVLSENQFLSIANKVPSTDRTFGRFRLLASTAPNVSKDDVDIGCILGFLLDILTFLLDVILTIFTFGLVDNPLRIDVSEVLNDLNIQAALGVISIPIELKDIKPKEPNYNEKMKKLEITFDDVQMTPDGLTTRLGAKVSPTMTDASVDSPTAGSPDLTPASIPMPIQPDADNTYFVLSDDTLNQLFASMTVQGEVQTTCVVSKRCTAPVSKMGDVCKMSSDCNDGGPNGVCTTRTFGDILPADCDNALFDVIPRFKGLCHAAKGGPGFDCETLNPLLFKFKVQGACHGWKGDECSSLPVQPLDTMMNEREFCNSTPFYNLFANMPFLVCAKLNNPPAIQIMDDVDFLTNMPVNTPEIVETVVRLNDLQMSMLIDRNLDAMGGEASALPGCFQSGSSTNGDCKLLSTCLDSNFPTRLSLEVGDTKECLSPETAKGQACTMKSDCGPADQKPNCNFPIMLIPEVQGVQIVVSKCTAPVAKFGQECKSNADCDTSMGSADGVCDTPGADVCSGGFNFGAGADTDINLLGEAGKNNANQAIMENVDEASPMLETEGLDIGGVATFANPKVIAIATHDACTNDGACFGRSCNGNADCDIGTCSGSALTDGKACCSNADCDPTPLGQCTTGLTGKRCLSPADNKNKTCTTDADCDTMQCSAPPSKSGDACSANTDCNVTGSDGVCGMNGVCKDECLALGLNFNDECDLVEKVDDKPKITAEGTCTVDNTATCNKGGGAGVCGIGERIPGFEDYLGITGDIQAAQ